MADRLLLLSYGFPPLAAPESLLAAKAAHSLADWEIDVVAAGPARWQRKDHDLVAWAEAAVRTVVRVPVPEWLPIVQPLRVTRQYPDAFRFLRRRTLAAVEELGLGSYDAVLTWSSWNSMHLVGRELKRRRPDLPWLAHFSDPWVENPMVELRGAAPALARRWESAVVREADALEFTAQATLVQTMARHPDVPAAKARVIPHLFEPSLFPARRRADPENIIVRHVGSFYGTRRPHVLVRAAEELLERRPDLADRLRVELIGPMPGSMRRSLATSALPPGCLRLRPRVSYRESLALMVDADLVVVIDPPATTSIYLASKLVDYLGSGTPILALAPPGAAVDVVRAMGGWVADPAAPDAAAGALSTAVEHLEHGVEGRWGDDAVRSAYSARSVGADRSALLRSIASGP